jgi:hypothetical protein
MSNNKQQTEMNKEFVPYELALELKQLGFDEPCLSYFDSRLEQQLGNFDFTEIKVYKVYNESASVLVPTFSQAFRWFRNNYRLNTQIAFCEYSVSSENAWKFTLDNPTNVQIWNGKFSTYEEAELECLKKLIKIVKNK